LVLDVPGVVRYEQNRGLKSGDPTQLDEPSQAFNGEIDGCYSLWFESDAAAEAALRSPEWARAAVVESTYVDAGKTYGVHVREHVKRL
jgi:hypothetical protein